MPTDNFEADFPRVLSAATKLLEELPRRNVKTSLMAETREGPEATIRPFVLMPVSKSEAFTRTFCPVWLEVFKGVRSREDNEKLALLVVYGKPISRGQTINDYSSLPLVQLGMHERIQKANLIGLETQATFSSGDADGEVCLVNAPLSNGKELLGLYCETAGAARQLLEKYGLNT